MDKNEFKEKRWEFIFGIIAIVAAVAEMVFNGINAATVSAAIKDVFGTVIVIVVFAAVIKDKIQKLPDKLEGELDVFAKKYSPLIFKVRDYEVAENYYEQGFCILKDMSRFIGEEFGEEDVLKYSSRYSKQTTKFIDMPASDVMLSQDFKICFRTLQTCEYDADFIKKTCEAINSKFANEYEAKPYSTNLVVSLPKITNKEQVDKLISLFEIVIVYFQIGNKGVKNSYEN